MQIQLLIAQLSECADLGHDTDRDCTLSLKTMPDEITAQLTKLVPQFRE